MQRNSKKLQWTTQEINLLSQLHPRFTSKRWKMISKVFKDHGFIRSELECREKWINFVDPSINNQEWDIKELEELYQLHEKHGTRWCMVQKAIGRTQNRIKNRFYGTLRNYIRFVLNVLSERQTYYNYEISKLSPRFLNSMYKGEEQFQFMHGEVKKMIFQMKYRINKKILADRIRKQKSLYLEFEKLILSAFPKSSSIQEIEEVSEAINPRTSQNKIKHQENEPISSQIKIQVPNVQILNNQIQNQQFCSVYNYLEQQNMLMNYIFSMPNQENVLYYPYIYY